jgi:cytochrome c oxidase assembly protein subunit 11
VALMGGLSFAAVPLYDLFCRVTGYGGTTQVAATAPAQVLDRTIRVRFDASVAAGMPWQFAPEVREIEIRLGETGLAFFTATNPTGETVAGTASFNVVPYAAGRFFTKIACFCFDQQVLAPGETVRMPVTFFVDPAMLEDAEARHARDITLSYTFHRTPLPPEAARKADETTPTRLN